MKLNIAGEYPSFQFSSVPFAFGDDVNGSGLGGMEFELGLRGEMLS